MRRDRRLGTALVLGSLLIGVFAGGQRHYYNGSAESCVKAAETIGGTILAGL
jgi:hypothetical protein